MSVNEPTPVLIPLVNPNEPEAVLVQIHVREGQKVGPGDLLCTLETTKSTAEVVAETGGYVIGLNKSEGQSVSAGDILCYLADDPDWKPKHIIAQSGSTSAESTGDQSFIPDLPSNLRITQPALKLAHQHGLNLSQLPGDRLITESQVRSILGASGVDRELGAPTSAFDATAIIVYGGGGHGKALIDLLHVLSVYHIVGVLDDGLKQEKLILGVPVLGGGEQLARLHQRGVRQAVNAVGGIGNVAVRVMIFQRLAEAGFVCPPVVHPTAFVESSAALAPGVQVMSHAYVGSGANLGFGVIVNTGAIVSHDCQVGDYANISPGAILAGDVYIGARALIGMGVTINLGVKVGAGARIGNGSTVIKDVPQNGLVRAGAIWPAP